MTAYGFETSKLTRTGVLFGTANFFFMLASGMVAAMVHHSCHSRKIFALIPLFFGLIFLIAAKKSFRSFLYLYKSRTNKTESEEVKTIALSGKRCGFISALVVSFLFSIVGCIVALIAGRKSLRARFGAFVGLGAALVAGGVFLAFHGVPPVLVFLGLLLIQISAAHFKRAIASAEAKEGVVSDCC
jgi:hypothetical protein